MQEFSKEMWQKGLGEVIPETDLTVEVDEKNVVEFPDAGIAFKAIANKIIILVDDYKSGYECAICGGTGKLFMSGGAQCPACKGTGHSLHIPEVSQSLPSTGVIVSIGEDCAYWKNKTAPIRVGARVIFGPHIGTFIPIKGKIKIKMMTEKDPLAVIFGAAKNPTEFIDSESDVI
jgi:co-chaperonin GroES (HSP10)